LGRPRRATLGEHVFQFVGRVAPHVVFVVFVRVGLPGAEQQQFAQLIEPE
jgi:hypothetical protein